MNKNLVYPIGFICLSLGLFYWMKSELASEREAIRKERHSAEREDAPPQPAPKPQTEDSGKKEKDAADGIPGLADEPSSQPKPKSKEREPAKPEGKKGSDPGDLLTGLLDTVTQAAKAVDRVGLDLTRMSDEDESDLGQEMNKQFLAEAKLVRDAALLERLKKLANPILEQRERKAIRYRIGVFEEELPNACSFAGGYVYLTTGLLKHFPSDAALTMVIGHEVGHIDKKHCIEKVQYCVMGQRIAGGLAGIAQAAYSTLRSPYSKEEEFEADEFGFRAGLKAGYSAPSLIKMLRDLEKLEHAREGEEAPQKKGDKTGNKENKEKSREPNSPLDNYFSSHPATSERVARLEKMAKK